MKAILEQTLREGRHRLVMDNPYFKVLPEKKAVSDFEAMCVDVYHISCEFLRAIMLRYERFQDAPEEIFKSHVEEETGHAEMLRNWMLEMGMVDPATRFPSQKTEHFLSLVYRAAATMSKNQSLLVINGAGEGVAEDFFSRTYDHFQRIGFPKLHYWHLHAEVDQEHGDILHLLSEEMDEQEWRAGQHYLQVTLDTMYEMIAGWLREEPGGAANDGDVEGGETEFYVNR